MNTPRAGQAMFGTMLFQEQIKG